MVNTMTNKECFIFYNAMKNKVLTGVISVYILMPFA